MDALGGDGPSSVVCVADATTRDAVLARLAASHIDVVAVVPRGTDALDEVARHLPDVVVLDLRAAGITGVRIVGAIIALSPRTKVVVVVPLRNLITEALDAGAVLAMEVEDLRPLARTLAHLTG